MMTLPFPPRRSELAAFWLVLNGGLALGLAIVLIIVGRSDLLWLALALPSGLALLGLLRRDFQMRCFSYWRRGARTAASAFQRWVLLVTYYVVISLVARGGSSIKTRSPDAAWSAFREETGLDASFSGGDGAWMLQIVRSARAPDRIWWLALLPFLMMISLFQGKSGEKDIPTNIYTLY